MYIVTIAVVCIPDRSPQQLGKPAVPARRAQLANTDHQSGSSLRPTAVSPPGGGGGAVGVSETLEKGSPLVYTQVELEERDGPIHRQKEGEVEYVEVKRQ